LNCAWTGWNCISGEANNLTYWWKVPEEKCGITTHNTDICGEQLVTISSQSFEIPKPRIDSPKYSFCSWYVKTSNEYDFNATVAYLEKPDIRIQFESVTSN